MEQLKEEKVATIDRLIGYFYKVTWKIRMLIILVAENKKKEPIIKYHIYYLR